MVQHVVVCRDQERDRNEAVDLERDLRAHAAVRAEFHYHVSWQLTMLVVMSTAGRDNTY